ncbi:glycosyltransferase family 4 protein [Litorihabitans aurantiacus]|uniref:D-inositol 3-phosphate glycosyltransferase n=1 Tax=Litorihabitans aurantiacus TaxID=1930061 RepID=A0AA37XG52_9MICO|nr:glycosyltransferase family 4 protein [Litorihabitans aurantiacus]GMA32701.1 glycosyltransferase WbuB [Litorihabitans aurantiacus]
MRGAVDAGALLRQLLLGARTAAAMAREDPARLVVLASRRAPEAWRGRLSDLLAGGAGRRGTGRRGTGRRGTGRRGAGLPGVLAAWVRGDDDAARAAVAAHLATGRARRPGPATVLAAEIGVQLDVPGAERAGTAATRVRALARRGDLSDAVAAAGPGTTQGRRLAAERTALTPGTVLAPSRRAASARRPSRGDRTGDGGPPRVLHLLTTSLPHSTSGYALRSHEVLRAQRRAGIDAVAATRPGYPVDVGRLAVAGHEVLDDVVYHRLPARRRPPATGARLRDHADAALALAREERPDVLHTTTPWSSAVVTRAVARDLGVPWVYEVRGVLEDTWVASFPPELRARVRASERYRLLRARETELTRAADRVVVLGETVRDALVARGVDPARLAIAPNAVEDRARTPDRSPARARRALGLPTDGFWVGTVSSLVPYEGLETLIEAVATERSAGRDVRACLVGDGVARPGLQRLVVERDLTDVVLLPGRVPAAEAGRWYQALDVVAVPRIDAEVTRTVVPLKPMAAMALGRPLIASDLPALAEIVGRPGAGLLTPPGDAAALARAVARLAADDDLRRSLARAGRAYAATRTWDAVGRTYRTLYDGLIEDAS